jgi:hypothetical protein
MIHDARISVFVYVWVCLHYPLSALALIMLVIPRIMLVIPRPCRQPTHGEKGEEKFQVLVGKEAGVWSTNKR